MRGPCSPRPACFPRGARHARGAVCLLRSRSRQCVPRGQCRGASSASVAPTPKLRGEGLPTSRWAVASPARLPPPFLFSDDLRRGPKGGGRIDAIEVQTLGSSPVRAPAEFQESGRWRMCNVTRRVMGGVGVERGFGWEGRRKGGTRGACVG